MVLFNRTADTLRSREREREKGREMKIMNEIQRYKHSCSHFQKCHVFIVQTRALPKYPHIHSFSTLRGIIVCINFKQPFSTTAGITWHSHMTNHQFPTSYWTDCSLVHEDSGHHFGSVIHSEAILQVCWDVHVVASFSFQL